MNKKLVITMVVIATLVLTTGVVGASSKRNITKKLGGVKGDQFTLNGSLIVDSFQANGNAFFKKPLTNPTGDLVIADNVRIDGRVYRGATAGSGDSKPFIVNDNMEVAGNLTVNGTITTASLEEVLQGVVSISSGYASASAVASTWAGKVYDVCQNQLRETNVTVTFTPVTDDTGTWTSNPLNIFRASIICGPEDAFPRGTYTGNYKVIDDVMMAYGIVNPNGASVTIGGVLSTNFRGNTLNFLDYQNVPQVYVQLTKQ